MPTFDLTFGNIAGLQMQGGAQVGVNFFEIDFAEVNELHPTLAGGDLLTIGHLPKGAFIHCISGETLVACQATGDDISLQDDSSTPNVIFDNHAISAAGTISGPKAGAVTYLGLFLTEAKTLNVLLGAEPPTKGKIRVAVAMSLMTGLG